MAVDRSMMLSENWGDLLDPRFSKIYDTEYKERINNAMVPMLFKQQGVSDSFYKVSGMGGFSDLQDFAGSITYDAPSQLYDTTFTFPEKALGFKIARKLNDDQLFGMMDGKPRGLAMSVARTEEKLGAEIWNGSFTTVHPTGHEGGDGVALCSSSHPYSPDDATTQDNSGTTAFSAAAVEATRRIGFTDILTDRGELAEVNYDTILVPVALEEDAYEIINSKGKVETANNNVNFHYGRYKLAVWARLASATNWWMIDSVLARNFFYAFSRVAPEFEYDRDFDTKASKWSVYMRKSCGYADWRPVYGHVV